MNRQITLAAHPVGFPKVSDFHFVEAIPPKPGAGEVLVRSLYLSVDPYMRGRMSGVNTYAHAVQIGEVMPGAAVGRVEESHDPRYEAGDIVEAPVGWQDYAVCVAKSVRKVDPAEAPVTTALHVLGMPGLTAYFGMLDICRPQPGETVVVSAAAGAVGSLAGQIARIKRCRVVGVAGSDTKVDFVVRGLGFDAAFNYRTVSDYEAQLRHLCPAGIDVYFDNVGGPITDAVMRLINTRARVAVCGQISQYNQEKPEAGPRWLPQLIVKQAKVEGFLVFQYSDRYEEGLRQLKTWLKQGRLQCREQIAEGLENAPRAFIGMLRGENIGKQLVKVVE